MTERQTRPGSDDLGVDVPEADALEQQRPAADTGEADDEVVEVPTEVDPADRLEQARAVGEDDDERR